MAAGNLTIEQIAGFCLPNCVGQVLKEEVATAIKRNFFDVGLRTIPHPFSLALAIFEDFVSFDDRVDCSIGTGSHLEDVVKAQVHPLFICLGVTIRPFVFRANHIKNAGTGCDVVGLWSFQELLRADLSVIQPGLVCIARGRVELVGGGTGTHT